MNALLAVAAYVFTPVVVPGALIFNFFGPNDRGQIVLDTTIGSGVYGDGTFTPLPPPPAGYFVSALGINNAGTVVGDAYTLPDYQQSQGFILTGSAYRIFSRPGWANTEPRFIGNSGLVTGWSVDNTTGQSAGFVYDPATHKFTDATPPGSVFTIVQGINGSGVISGNGRDPSGAPYGFIWQQGKFENGNGQVPFIDRFLVANENRLGIRARGINDAGLIVGFTGSGSSGFVGNTVLGFQLLNVPGDHVHGASTICEGINNSGQVLCAYEINDDFDFHVFIGTPRDGDDHDGDHGNQDPR